MRGLGGEYGRGWRAGLRAGRVECSELLHHAEVVADRPALRDAAVFQPVHERDVALVAACGDVDAAELTPGPVALAGPVLHDVVVVGHDDEVLPPVGAPVAAATSAQELPGAGRAGRPPRR